ncbi:MAG: AI-2E family transporter [Pseudomonadota bacterium]
MEQHASSKALFWFFLALFLVSMYLLGKLLWPFVSVLVLGAVVTGLFKPAFRYLAARIGDTPASLLTCLLILVIVFIPTVLLVGVLSKEAYGLYLMGKNAALNDQVRQLLENNRAVELANDYLAAFNIQFSAEQVNRALSESGKVVGLFLYQQASAIASNVLNFVVYFLLMILVVYYLLMDGDRLMTFIVELSPMPNDEDIQLIEKFKDMAGAVLVGNGVCGLIQGIAGGLAFSLAGIPSAILWGVIMGLLAFLPIVGIGIVFVPAAILLVLKGRILAGICFIFFYIVLSGGVEYILKPKIVGHRVKMHTLLVFLAILGGLKLFGILGIIYGPLVVTGFLTLTDIYHANYQRMVEEASPDPQEDRA